MNSKKIKILFHSNYSRMVTGFGKNMKNVLFEFFQDERFEIAEAGNGVRDDVDSLTPWKFYGTYPSTPNVLNFIKEDARRNRLSSYGGYCIDGIIKDFKPDIYVGIEDPWAFIDFQKKPWWQSVNTVLWMTIDSLPILPQAYEVAQQCDQPLVWASFAEKEMASTIPNIKTIHGAIDYSSFKPLNLSEKKELRQNFGFDEEFIVGFVFKNQLRKSVPNLLRGFKKFQEEHCRNAKLLLHTDWSDFENGWNIPSYIKEMNLDPEDILCCYKCSHCGKIHISKYEGNDIQCPFCKTEKSLKTKTSLMGVSEKELNDLYNIMDVYCHPFTSGGQEIPIQEAKAAGLITLVTEYSCGTDSCYEEQGGLPLLWNEYREPSTNFIKASTCPKSICDQLAKVFFMSAEEKQNLINNGIKYVREEFSTQNTVGELKKIFLSMPKKEKIDFDFDSQEDLLIPKFNFSDNSKKMLVFGPESKEDSILLNGAINILSEKYPHHKIYIAVQDSNDKYLQDNPLIHGFIKMKPALFLPENILGEGKFEFFLDLRGIKNLTPLLF